MSLVPAPLHRGARLPLPQTIPRLDHGPPARSGGGRPLELAAGSASLATPPRQSSRGRSAIALGTPGRLRAAESRTGPSGFRGTFVAPPSVTPKPRGKAPGRQLGQRPGRYKRYAVVRRPPNPPPPSRHHRRDYNPLSKLKRLSESSKQKGFFWLQMRERRFTSTGLIQSPPDVRPTRRKRTPRWAA